MKSKKSVKDFDYLNILLTLSGVQPVFDRKQKNGGKYSIIGIICVLVHSVLCIYCDHIAEEEQRVIRRFLMNIMFGLTYLHRFYSLVYPLLSVIGAIVQFKALNTFLDSQDQLTLYLSRCSMDTDRLQQQVKQMQIWSAISCLVLAALSSVSYVYYSEIFSRIQFSTYYTGVFFSLNYMLVVAKVCNHFYAYLLRLNLYCDHLKVVMGQLFIAPVRHLHPIT